MVHLSDYYPLFLALLLSGHGLRKKSLSPSGALAAFVVGFLMMSGGVRVFGVALIGFYLAGSRATKCECWSKIFLYIYPLVVVDGKKRKAQLEDGYQEAGYRTGWQVLCNSASGFAAAFLWNAAFVPTSIHARIAEFVGIAVFQTRIDYDNNGWCPLSRTVANGWSRRLVLSALGHFACCLGDTLASELGILSSSRPKLITTLRTVPAGTNGAISVGGTVASIAGGGFIGMLVEVTMVIENSRCSIEWSGILFESVAWGMCGGGMGSLVDSLLGATVQETRYSNTKRVVLQDTNKTKDGVRVISGINLLSNNQVNLVSSVICAVMVGWIG
ncbi:hypothetical protein M413DRAFT_77158 [Hebeloma cylindrosporum]|uniref:Transmembrane protein 19 n=1 Tax=Hebeloma cylindrosporum TaxID=76867 RepID=A0A0C3BL83_HEBCY|nr:hypothetical protein M413DRAFT_77158 [Hebeloma cylindrosporum h7]